MQKLEVQFEGQVFTVYTKLEFMNPSGSIKDRMAKYIVEEAERRGDLKTGYTIVEYTSGNTGIALSMVAASKGYKAIVVMPEHMTGERVELMRRLGAELCLTPKAEGFEGAVRRAEKIAKSGRNYFLSDQFRNKDNVMAHYYSTGQEIIQQIAEVHAFVAGVGTGGTLMGVGKALRERNHKTRLVAVEPEEAAILSGRTELHDHKIAGIGDGLVPDILDVPLIDDVIAVKSDDAVAMAKTLQTVDGLMVGVSSGANVLASIRVLQRLGSEKNVVTVLPDRSERYFSTDLYAANMGTVRRCSDKYECPFDKF
jgi:cysteine synthase A